MGVRFDCCFCYSAVSKMKAKEKKKKKKKKQTEADDGNPRLFKSLSLKGATRVLSKVGSFRPKAKVMNHEAESPPATAPCNPDADSGSDEETTFHSAEAWEDAKELEREDDKEKAEFLAFSCGLKRSCSDLGVLRIRNQQINPKSVSCREIAMRMDSNPMEPRCREDKEIKKHSSARILPSKSQSLLWNLLLWNDNISQKPKSSPFAEIPINTFVEESESQGPVAAISLSRVSQWVMESPTLPPDEIDHVADQDQDQDEEDASVFPSSPGNKTRGSSEITHASSLVQSLDSSSTVAYVAGVGLKVIPSMSHLSSLRAINLSGNSIVNIPQDSLPKSLHVLDLSRNKIQTIQGFRELTRLRNLDLSHNRISRIGQGLSSCTMIKELYLSGNKISMVEGLHRLLKLTVLDLSNNKITAAKALGQLVANYNSLMALDLSGNPLQANTSNDHLRKVVRAVLPKLAFLNKDPIDLQKAREINEDAKAKGVNGNGVWNNRNRTKSGNKLLQSQWSSTSRIVRSSSKQDDKKMKERSKSNVARYVSVET